VNNAIVTAAIGLAGGLLGALIALFGQFRLSSRQVRRDTETVLAKYREPLLGAAYELQGRLWNILDLDFLRKYCLAGDEAQRTYAVENTLFVIAQYFGWSEILRSEIQFLSFSDSEQTRTVNACQSRIVQLFQSDEAALGRPFLLWRGEQRAIGELMIDTVSGQPRCIGYASFMGRRESSFRSWFERLESDIAEISSGANPRLLQLQHALIDLIRELDPQGLRYPEEVARYAVGRITEPAHSESRNV
jgi:hypothetical protein